MTLTTRMPEKTEAHLDIKAFNEAFKLYGTNQNFSGGDANAALGNKVGNWAYWMSMDHLNSFGHPTIFGWPAAGGS
jgi:iron complex outermembrane receptor protein